MGFENLGGVNVNVYNEWLKSHGGNVESAAKNTIQSIKKVDAVVADLGATSEETIRKLSKFEQSINKSITTMFDKPKKFQDAFGGEANFKKVLGYFSKVSKEQEKIESKQKAINKLYILAKAGNDKSNILQYKNKDVENELKAAWLKQDKKDIYKYANILEANLGTEGAEEKFKKLGDTFISTLRNIRTELDSSKGSGFKVFKLDELQKVFSVMDEGKEYLELLENKKNDILKANVRHIRSENKLTLPNKENILEDLQEYLSIGGRLTDFTDEQIDQLKKIQNIYNAQTTDGKQFDILNINTDHEQYLKNLAATTEMVADKKENADEQIQESAKETADVVEQSAKQEVKAQNEVGESADKSAKKQKKAKEETKKASKDAADAVQKKAKERVEAEEKATAAVVEGVEKQKQSTEEQIKSQKELAEAYRDTLKNKSISSLENNIAQNEYKIKKGDKNKEELEWQLSILKEVLSLKQKEAEKQKYIEQETKRVRKEMDKQEKGRLANIERETQALEQQREEVELQRKESERLENISKEQLRIRNEQDDDAKYLSQRGIVGDEAGWSVVKELGFARTQQINYGYNKDTGLLEENPAAVITNYEKLKNAIIATDKAVQTLEHDLKVIQTKHPGIDTSYLEKNLSATKSHLDALNEERDLYAQSADYMETYIEHNKEIEAAHNKTKNSLAQKDVVSKYAEQLRAEKDAQKLLIDTNNKLLSLEEERFRIQNSLNLGKSKNEIKDKERILEIEKETNDLLVRRYNLRVQYNTYDNKAAAKIAQRKTNNDIQLDYNKQQKEQNDNTAELSKQLSVIEKYNKEQSKLNVLKAKDAKFNRSSFSKNEITEQESFVKQLSSDAYQAIMVIKQLRTEGKITKDEFKNALKQFTNAKLGTLSIAQVKDINANSDLAKAKYTEKAAANELEKIYKKLYSLEEARFIIQNKLNLNKSRNEIKDSENLISINKRINELLERRDKLAKYHNVRDDDKAKDFEYKQLVNDIQLDENKDAFNQGKITKIYKEQLEIIEQYNKEQSKLNVLKEQANKINGKTVYDARIKEQEEVVAKARQSAQDALDIIEKQRKVSQISIGQWDNAKNAFYNAEKGTLTASQVSDMQATQKRIQAAKTEKQALESLDASIKNVETSFKNLAKVSSANSGNLVLNNAKFALDSALKKFNDEKEAAKQAGISDDDIEKKETDLLDSLGISIDNSTIGVIQKFSDKIHSAAQEIFESGKLSASASNDFLILQNSLNSIVKNKNLKSFDGIKDFLNELSKFSGKLDENLDTIRKQSEITWITDMASGFDKFTNKSDEFVNTLSTLKSKISAYNQALAGKDANLIGQLEGTLLKDAPKLINKLNNMLSGKGTLFEDSEGQVHTLSDLNTWILKYANSQKLVLDYGSKLKTENNAVTGTFKDQNGQVIKLTATMDELSHSMKIVSSAQKPIKTLGVAFKDVIKEGLGAVQAHIDVNDVINKVISSAQKGIETLKQYDSALTNISYTMNMTKDNLSDLGESAVDMAQDLGLSLDNTLKIYQIYANMQTTAEEIAETAKPTAILSNLSGVDASTASDQIQGILNQFNMLKDADVDAAKTSMHVVDVLDKISANVAIDYAKGIGIITDAVTATGSAAADAGMSYEQLAAVSAKVAERTREDGSSIGNAIKTILTRISKVGKMPGYADEVDNETLSKASESLNEIGIAVYNADGSFRNISVILGELAEKWDGLTDAQQSNISYNVAATRQSNKFRAILEAWTSATELATDATNTLGNAEANQEKYLESYNGKIQQIKTNMDAFWLSLFNSEVTSKILDFLINITELLNTLSDTIGSGNTALLAGGVLTGLMTGMKYLKDNGLKDTIKNFGRAKMFALYKYAEINRCSLGY